MMTNKKLIYGIVIVVLAVVVIGLIILNKPTTTPTIPETETKDAILSELERLNIEIVGQPKQIELQLPPTLSDANWGLKKIICEEGGYNLSVYAGRTLLFTSYLTNEIWNNTESLNVWIVSSGDKIACVYKTVTKSSNAAPGIFSVKENPNIKKK